MRRGMTLLEVLIAVALLAIGLGSAYRSAGALVNTSQLLIVKQLALCTIQNLAVTLSVEKRDFSVIGDFNVKCPNAGYDFVCLYTIQETENNVFRRATIRAVLPDNPNYDLATISTLLLDPAVWGRIVFANNFDEDWDDDFESNLDDENDYDEDDIDDIYGI